MEGKINSNLVYRNIFGNLFLFAPLSMFMFVFFKKTKAFLKNAALVFSCVLFAEVFQMIFRVGSFDVDDIILNMLGSFIGFSVMKIKCIDSLVRSIYN
jgi:glycopeptide antibiotics resistance protein